MNRVAAHGVRCAILDAERQPRSRMKILYLNPTGLLGGAERSLLDVLASVKTAEPDWTLALVAGGDGPLVERARALGVATTVVALPDSIERIGDAGAGGPAGSQLKRLAMLRAMAGAACAVPRYTRRLGRQIDEIAPDLVHTNGFKMHILGAWATRRKRPVVWHIHDYVSMRPVMAKLMRFEVRRCAAAIANSDSVRSDARAVCGVGLDVVTVYNAVNLDEFNPSGRVIDLDVLAGLAPAPSGTIRLGLVATMARWKGHEVFLQAIASLPGEAPVRAYVIGDAVYHTDGSQVPLEALRSKARALGLGDRVGFTGFIRGYRSGDAHFGHRRSCEYCAGAVRSGHCGSDGIGKTGNREPGWRRGRDSRSVGRRFVA